MLLEQTKCCGCNNCTILCPKKAVTLEKDMMGYEYPVIDESKCINCKRCVKNCPCLNYKELMIPKKVYAAWSIDKNTHKNSTSGGVATELARYAIEQGGVVYGTTYTSEKFVHVMKVDNLDDIWKLQGSKYVKSNMNQTILGIAKDVKEFPIVLFIGTPCQCSSVKNAVGEKENLICVDLVCHGTPSQDLLKEDMLSVGCCLDKINQIKFRNEGKFEVTYYCDSNIQFYSDWAFNKYYLGFMKQLTYSTVCYDCPYAKIKRIGEITIGDFWGLGNHEPFEEKIPDGISLLMVNNSKGIVFWERCKDRFKVYERSLDEAVEGNSQLRHPSVPHPNRDKFLTYYPKYGYTKTMRRCLRWDLVKKYIRRWLMGTL